MSRILVTGAAGFIGCELALRLLARGDEVVGLDNLNAYYDVSLKEARLRRLEGRAGFRFARCDLADAAALADAFRLGPFDRVAHMAAQAGVRHSLDNPAAYIQSNLVGFGNLLEQCRRQGVGHLAFASSSSVYGANTKLPYSVRDNVDHPISLYAATKKSNELMAHSYAHLFRLPATGLRFFTVYGPWGRPDMAPLKFTKAIFEGRPIEVYNHGRMQRDFTYIDDIVEGVVRTLDRVPAPDAAWSGAHPDPGGSSAPYRIYNIGNHTPVGLLRFIEVLETAIGRPAIKQLMPIQPGDVEATYADVGDLARDVGFAPHTPIEDGLARLVAWYREYYGVS
ncbi:MAG: NAD-dependent epimerase [Gammaproteobacteria bacterium]|nr:NAD-dependent epimerase [Gammaproteobacteria bacterium]